MKRYVSDHKTEKVLDVRTRAALRATALLLLVDLEPNDVVRVGGDAGAADDAHHVLRIHPSARPSPRINKARTSE
jgi:hypothetical protein